MKIDRIQKLEDISAELLKALEIMVERERAEASDCGLADSEMTWLTEARRAIAKAKRL